MLVILHYLLICNGFCSAKKQLKKSFRNKFCAVQYRKWSPTANDPETANDPQNGPQMILDRKWSPKSTVNDPERKIGMA